MKSKHRKKMFSRAIARHGLFICAWLFDKLPLWAVNSIARVFLFIGYTFTIRQRNIAIKSLKFAFREENYSEKKINQIVKKCFYNFGWGMVEMLYYLAHPQMVEKKVSFQGLDRLDAALKKGNGVIAVTAHFGNFPLMMLAFAQKKYKVSCVIRPTRDKEVEAFLQKKRTEVGLNTVYAKPRRHTVTESLRVLRNNEILFIPIDQNFGSDGGVFVDFFGQKAATAPGPVIFANRTKAPIIPMFTLHDGDGHHKVIIEEPIEVEQGKDEKETIFLTMSKITSLIEKYIRKYPDEWAWMHRRWKSRPYPIRYCPNA